MKNKGKGYFEIDFQGSFFRWVLFLGKHLPLRKIRLRKFLLGLYRPNKNFYRKTALAKLQ